MKKPLLLISMVLIVHSVYAQFVPQFSNDTAQYLNELDQLFGSQLTEQERISFDAFMATWDSLEIDARKAIMDVSGLMRLRSCRPRPHYITYIEIINGFFSNARMQPHFLDWMKGYAEFMRNEETLLKQINNMNNSTLLLLEDNILYRSVSVKWKLKTSGYRFDYDDRMKVTVDGNTLICFSGGDSIEVHEVHGYLDPLNQRFYGQDGMIYWDRAGFEKNQIYASLSQFTIQLKEPGYAADSVLFVYRDVLGEPALGRLEDRVTQIRSPEQAKYPQFFTYQSSYDLRNFIEGINYSGGISMQGANLAGTGIGGRKAVLEVFSNDTLRMVAGANQFLFSTNAIRSNSAEISIYIERDSIYHPDLILNYNIPADRIRLTKSEDYNSQGPYANSYHRLDMNFQELSWVRSESEMNFQAALGSALGNASFESYDFFNMQFYESLQGMDWQHPLADLWGYARMVQTRTFPVTSYAVSQGKDPYIVRHQLMQFSQLGFVYFDFEKDDVTLRDKLYDYIDASLQQRDYDVMRFISRTTSASQNAILNLYNHDLTIFGIPAIFLSDSQNVKLVPTNNTIVMKRDRNFQFDGAIDAGLFKFYGKNFFFEYDNFRLNLQNIDSLSMSALTGERDGYGNPLITTIDNKIENITGELLIDAPFNKSGLMHYPEYPIFTSRENCYIYFDEPSIQDGVYDRDRFYFELVPFSIDSLDNFSRDNIKLEGTFTSANVLPEMQMEMTLRPDNSLGFYMSTPEQGLPIYGGKGIFYNDIEMSSKGLHGYGSFDFITSTTWSDDFLFHPDSMLTTSRKFLEREQEPATSYPYVENTTADVRFYPFEDELTARSIDQLFTIFNENTVFKGMLSLRPNGLKGNGILGFPDARMASNQFAFTDHIIRADSAGLSLRPEQGKDYNFLTDNVRVHVDLDEQKGEFTAREDYTLIQFPENLYEARLDQLTWFLDRKEIELKQDKYLAGNDIDIGIDSLRINAPWYVSVHPRQDSLTFASPIARFDYIKSILHAEEVPFVEVGDAYIFPENGDVEIREQANMMTLYNARLLANKDSRYHLMHTADLKVDSRLHFKGAASYDYVDEFGNVSTFRLDQLEVDTSIETRGYGTVKAEEEFMLSPYFAFRGDVRMNASDPLLDFAGGTRIVHDCSIVRGQWLKFESRLDPDSLIIPTGPSLNNQDLRDIYAGTLIARDSTHIYPTFLSGRKNYFDRNITDAIGYVYYDKLAQDYELGSIQKIRNDDEEGDLVRFETDSCTLYGEGRINLRLDYGRVSYVSVGNATHDIEDNSLNLHLILGLNFLFSPEALQMFGNELDSIPDLEPVDLTSSFYRLGLKNLVGTTTADQMETDLGLTGSYSEIPDSMKFSILFNDLPLRWNQESRSFRYNGKVGIGLIGDVQVNKKVDAYIEFVERGSGDIFDIYLMVNPETWYYFAYSPGGLQVLSSNRNFNQFILDLPEKDRRIRGGVGAASYIYSVSSTRRLQLFLDRFMSFEEEQGSNRSAPGY
jgi:hypothetical protein